METEYFITNRLVTFYSLTYVQALNGTIADGRYECNLTSGADIEIGVTYNPHDFSSCSIVDGGFSAGSLSFTYNLDRVYALAGYNGHCQVFYGITDSSPVSPLVSDPLSVGGRVLIRLGDVGCLNDNSCNITSSSGNCDATLGDESDVVFSPLGFQFTDPDGSVNTVLQQDIKSGNNDGYFSIDSLTGQLSLNTELDRDLGADSYNLEIEISDGLYSSTYNVTIYVLDQNDNSPIPSMPIFEASVPEGSPVGTLVLNVTFTDADDVENAKLVYTIEGSQTNFVIDVETGLVSTNRSFDYEAGDLIFSFTVTASDNGAAITLSGTVNVIINIEDINDNIPVVMGGLIENAAYIEDGDAVRVADIVVTDDDVNFNLIFAVIEISNAIDDDEFIIATVPENVKSGSINSSLYIVGNINTSAMSTILKSAHYNHTAEEITPPLNRTIIYSVCDRFIDDSILPSLSLDTQNAIVNGNASNLNLSMTDINILSTSCSEMVSLSVVLPLIPVNDRPRLIDLQVEFQSIPEDSPDEINIGELVGSVFQDAIYDPDGGGFIGVALVGHYSTSDPQYGSVGTTQQCMNYYTMLYADCNLHDYEVGPASYQYAIAKCQMIIETLSQKIKFWFLRGNTITTKPCTLTNTGKRRRRQTDESELGSVDFSDVFSIRLVLATGDVFNLTSVFVNPEVNVTLTFSLTSIESFDAFIRRNGTYNLDYVNGSTVTIPLDSININYTDVGDVNETSSLVLGQYNLIRFIPHQNVFGPTTLGFKAWDGSDGVNPETSGVDTTLATSFSLQTGNTTINITSERDAPLIELGGSGERNYSTIFTENDSGVYITSRNASIIEFDESDEYLSNLTISITKEDGSCDLLDGQAFDHLFFPNVTKVDNITYVDVLSTLEIYHTGDACITYRTHSRHLIDSWNFVLRLITFTNFDDEPSDHRRRLEFLISDDFLTSPPSYTYIDIELVSDNCPVLVLSPITTLTYTEHGTPLTLDSSLNVTDDDRNPQLLRATISIPLSISCSECVLNSTITHSDILPSYNSITQTLTLEGPASPVAFQTVLRSIQFSDEADEPSVNLLTVEIALVDPTLSSCTETVGSISIVIDHINDNSPVIFLDWPSDQHYSTSYIEGNSEIRVTGSEVLINENDAQHSAEYHVFITISGCIISEDSLLFTSTPLTLSQMYTYDTSTCSVELIGDIEDLERDIEDLRYTNLNVDNPTEGTRTINFTILDPGVPSTESFSYVMVVAVNDPPEVYLNGISTDIMVSFELGDDLVHVTDDGTIIDHDNLQLQSISISLFEYDSTNTQLSSPSDGLFERIELEDDSILTELGLSYTVQTISQLTITGSADLTDYVTILNEIVYVNTRIPPNLNRREVEVIVDDGENSSAVAVAMISFVGALDPPVVDLNGDESGRDITTIYTLTTPGITLFPTGTISDPNGDQICRLEITLSGGSQDVCPSSSISFTSGGLDMEINEVVTSNTTTVFTVTSSFECRNNDIFEDILRGIVFQSDGTTGHCNLSVLAEDDSTLNSTVAMATVEIVAYNDPPFIDLDLGYVGRDYATVYYRGGRIRNIVSIFDPDTNQNISTVTYIGEAGEASLDGLTDGGGVFEEQSNAGYRVSDSDSSSLIYLQTEFIKSSNRDNDVITYPCKPRDTSLEIDPRGCTIAGQSIIITDMECDDDVFEACSSEYDLCTGLEIRIFCTTSALKAYRFTYPSSNSSVERYEALLGYLGYEYLLTNLSNLNQVRLIDISVSDGESTNSQAITRVKLQEFGLVIPDDDPLEFIVYEDERPERTITVFTVPVETLDGLPPDENSVRFEIIGGNEEGKFSIDELTGEISLEEMLDREETAQYHLEVSAQFSDSTDEDTRATAVIVGNVVDINDNHPVLQETFYVNVTEGTANVLVVDLNATDADEGINAELMYLLLGIGVENFYVTANGIVRARNALNVTEEDYYLLVVIVADMGIPSLGAHSVININVITPPPTNLSFVPETVDVPAYVFESSEIGHVFHTVQAIEVGGTIFGDSLIRYEIIGIEPQETPQPFEVNITSGDVYVSASLNSERSSMYQVSLRAFSVRSVFFRPSPDEAILEVIVQDDNEHAPVFIPPFTFSIAENSNDGVTVGTVIATDVDDMNMGITYSLDPATPAGLPFSVQANGDIEVDGNIDYEEDMVFNFNVLAVDIPAHGQTARTGSTQITININDLNDNAPVFIGTPYDTTVLETAVLNTQVISFSTTDRDSSANSMISYSSPDITSTPFCINGTSIILCDPTQLTLIEQDTVFEITIIATNPPAISNDVTHTTSTVVNITLILINEFDPTFANNNVLIPGLYEEHCGLGYGETCVGYEVYDFNTTDSDGGVNGIIQYSIISLNVPFTVDATTGKLTITGDIDREIQDSYTIQVMAEDNADINGIIRSSIANITITILDIDDNAPIIVEPFNFTVTENMTRTQSSFGRIQILDVDITGYHEYYIEVSGEESFFSGCILQGSNYLPIAINMDTGDLYFCEPVDFETQSRVYFFNVRVTDIGSLGPSSNPAFYVSNLTLITVRIVDFNDHAPIIENDDYIFSVEEERSSGTTVGAVVATDEDSGEFGNLQFSLVHNGSSHCSEELPFIVVKTSATMANIQTCLSLDYETQDVYNLELVVCDNATIPMCTSGSLTVNVIDRNDHAPVFIQLTYTAVIEETDTSMQQTIVVTVTVTDADSSINSISNFTILTPNTPFGISSVTEFQADVYVAQPSLIDYDVGVREYDITVLAINEPAIATDDTLNSTTTIHITITDDNDNAPIINVPFEFGVRENEQIDTEVGCVSANDIDDGLNSVLSYTIIDGSGNNVSCASDIPFSINGTGCLSTCEVFDYEMVTSYSFTVRVCDGGTPVQCSDMTITVNIIDLNDNPLVYTDDPFFVDFNENSLTGASVLFITYTDQDSIENSNAMFEFVDTLSPFAIRSGNEMFYTGQQSLDYETGPQTYILYLRGINQPSIAGDTTWTVDVVVTVNIVDRNDHSPVFELEEDTRVIPEHNDSFTYTLTTTDEDTEPNSIVSYSIINPSPFTIIGNTIVISDSDAIDYDPPNNISQYVIIIQATNEPAVSDDEIQSENFTLFVNVTDINDNAPECVGPNTFTILENATVSVSVTRYRANDIDSGLNGKEGLLYDVNDNGAPGSGDPPCSFDDPFRIYPESGYIYPCVSLDFEQQAVYNINITVRDSGVPSLVTVCPIEIIVVDINDNIPVLYPPTVFSISEEAQSLTQVGCINGSDEDTGDNGVIVYTFEEVQCSVFNPFQINPSTGCISVCYDLDFESITTYTLTLTLTDNAYPFLSVVGNITINVVNENDHSPVIISSNMANVTEEIDNAIVTTVQVEDLDAPPYNVVAYSLSDDASGLFTINSTTGTIFTTQPLDRETEPFYNIQVIVSDGVFTSTQNMTIFLIDVNDNSPVYLGNDMYSFFEESIFDFILVYSDTDTAINSVHSFNVNDTDFYINDTTTVLTNIIPLDRDPDTGGQPTRTIVITITDGENIVLTLITIILIDTNDNPPIPQPPFEVDILDGTNVGEVVLTVVATDADEGDNADISYGIDGTSNVFAIDTNSGNITVIQNITLDSDMSEDLTLTVRISDNGVDTQITYQNYTFTVVNLVPRFPQDLYEFYITENNLGGEIDTITAMDRDRDTSNDIFVYMILSVTPYDSGFNIISEGATGTLYRPSTYFDFEDSVQFELIVAVGRENMTIVDDETIVRVIVQDRNDNPPRLSPLNIFAEVPEDIANGTTVLTAVAIDFDRSSNGLLSYNHSGLGEEAFEFDSNGNFKVTDSNLIDFELESSFTFRYQACDAGSPQLCSEAGIINITISNVDDIPPVFNPSTYSMIISEDLESNREILIVEFGDEDTPLTDVILSLSPPQTLFEIAQVSGALMTTDIPLDRETQEIHEFYVVANDTSGQTASALITIILSDVNDVRPHVEPLQSTISITEGGSPAPIATDLTVIDGDDVSTYPLTMITVSLHPSPDSIESYPLTGGVCDHANYSFFYNENVYTMCGLSDSSCLYLLDPDNVVVSTGGSLIDKVLSTGSSSNFARYTSVFSGENFDRFSVSLWLRIESESASGSIFELRTSASFELNLQLDTNNDGTGSLTLFSAAQASTLLTTDQLNTHDNQWHQITVIRDEEYFTIYFDGIIEARDNTSSQFDNSFTTTGFFFGVGLDSEYLAELYMCLSNISQDDVHCSLTCGESFEIENTTDDVVKTIDLRTRSLQLEYTGNNNMASLTKLEEALGKVLYVYSNRIEEPHPLDRGVFIEVSDILGPSDERGVVTVVADLINDQKPVLDLNGFSETGIDFETTFEELSDGVVLISDDAALYDEDSGFSTVGRIEIEIISPTMTEEIFVSSSIEGLNITLINSSFIVITSSSSLVEHFPGLFLDALGAIRYRNLQDEPVQVNRVVQFKVYDAGETFINDPLAITYVTVVPTNDEPVLDLDSLSSTTRDTSVIFEEEIGQVRLLTGTSQTISDPDSTIISQAIIQFTLRPDGTSETLQLDSTELNTSVMEVFDLTTGQLTLGGSYDFTTWLEILRRVEYVNVYGNPDETVIRQVSMQVIDDGGGISSPSYVNISVVPFNNPPDIYLGGPGIEDFHTVFVEDGPCISIANITMEIVDVDSETIEFARATLQTTNADTVYESIRVVRADDDPPGNYINSNLLVFVTLDDPSLDNFELALPSILYCNSEDEPDEGTREIEVAVRDSGSSQLSAFSFTFIDIQRVNDRPTLQVESLNNISIRGVPTIILDKDSIVLEDSDDDRFLALHIFITNEQDGVGSETIIFDGGLPANTTSLGSLVTDNGEILNNVTFRSGGADASQVIETISNIRYTNTAPNLTVNPPRIICLQVADQSFYFSERVCVNVILSPPNFFSPVIISNFLPFTYSETNESLTITTVTAEDDDVDLAGQIEFSIPRVMSTPQGGLAEDSTASGIFEVDSTSGVLIAPSGLDAETYTHHIVTIRASDMGNPVEDDEIDIEISVTDINDNPPEFEDGPYSLPSVTEAQLSFGVVGSVEAQDNDLTSPNNDVVSYFLTTDDSRFEIDNSGEITYTEELNADVGDPNIVLTVGAIDAGTPPLTGYTTVSFLIGEINDYEARIEQVSPALFVVEDPPIPQSIGPAMRIDDIDLSDSTITSVQVQLTLNEADLDRTYAMCLTVCQPQRIQQAGLTTSFDLFQLPNTAEIFLTDNGNTDNLQFVQIDDSSCDAVRMIKGTARETDGYGRIDRSEFSSDFLSGDFSISFVAKVKSEGFIVVVPDQTNPDLLPGDVERDFGIWMRRRDFRFYYTYGSPSQRELLVYRLPIGEEFIVPTNSLEDQITRHYTVVVNSTEPQLDIYIDCKLQFTGNLMGAVNVPNPDSDVFIGQSRPSPVNGGRLGAELHGLFYHPQALTEAEIESFCSCGQETINPPSSIPDSINIVRTTSTTDVTLSLTPAQSINIPENDLVNVLRGIQYENTFNPPTFEPVRTLEFTVEENNNEDTAVTFGSIVLVTSDDTLPEIDLSGPLVTGIDYQVEFTEDDGAVFISNDVRLTRDVPSPAVATFNQILIVLKDSIDADEFLTATTTSPYITVFGSGTTSITIEGPGDSSDLIDALETVSYENTNDRPTTNFDRTIEFTVTDTKGDVNSPLAVTMVHVNAVNDAPQISLSDNGVVTMQNVEYNEGSEVGLNLAPDLSAVDVDSDTLQSAVVVLTSPSLFSDQLIIEVLPSQLTSSYNFNSGILTITGPASFNIFEEALRNITFESTDSPFLDDSGNPLSSTDRTATFTVSDGLDNSDPVTVNINFLPKDDPPHILGAPDSIVYTEGTPPINIAPEVLLADDDNDQLLSLQVDLLAPRDGDVLSDGTTSSNLLRFGLGSLSSFQSILRGITYVSNADEPVLSDRVIIIEVCDFNNCDEVTVTVEIENANDNTPVFERPTYVYNVAEDIEVGTTIDTLSVTDGDDREFFSTVFLYRTEPSVIPFRLDRIGSGDEIELIVNEDLDAETMLFHEFIIFVSDGGNEGSTSVNITVTNINEPPSITLETSTAVIVGSPSSETQLLQVDFSITDPDINDAVLQALLIVTNIPSGSNETLVYLPDTNDDNITFTPVVGTENQFQLELSENNNQTLEDALRDIYYAAGSEVFDTTVVRFVDVSVFDREGVESDIIRVTVSLASIPVFTQSTYNLSLTEGIIHSHFYQVEATVESGGDVINYAVQQSVGVAIDEGSGYLSLTELLDREAGIVKVFEVYAIDNLPPARTGTAVVSINILDANDVRPTVTVNQRNITIYTGIPTVLLPNITVTDPDTSSHIITATIRAVGVTDIVASPFTGEVCVDKHEILAKMEQICGLENYTDVLANQDGSSSGDIDEFGNLILSNTEDGYVNINTAELSSLEGEISALTTAFWFKPEESGYIVYIGRQSPIERYYAIYFDKDANQFIVTLKRVGLTGLEAQVRIIFQVTSSLCDGEWHFVMIQYSDRDLVCVIDGTLVQSQAVSFKEEPFIGQVTGKLLLSFHY